MKYFYSSIIILLIGLIIAFFIGGIGACIITAILSILEISLSFDNAVVNASVLSNMELIWRKRFITFGIPIAVFGMRLIFPLLIVSSIASISPIDAFNIAINNPHHYKELLESSHLSLMGFGGSFLILVALEFFLDPEKDQHWIHYIEKPMTRLAEMISPTIVVLLMITIIANFVESFYGVDGRDSFITSSLYAIIIYLFTGLIGSTVGDKTIDKSIKRVGLASFLYLELLDASFSLDGVIGAMALTQNIAIIMLGLGIGAYAVRSLTLFMVDKGALTNYVYLENGAYFAILSLALIMFIKTLYEVPEIVTGLIGVFFIGLSFISSIKYNRLSINGV